LRANYIVVEEFSSVNPEIFEVVIRGFSAVSSNPAQKVKNLAKIDKMKSMGKWTPAMENKVLGMNKPNQIVLSGTPSWDFNHFSDYWKKYHNIITGKTKTDDATQNKDYCIIRMPYNLLPPVMDEKALANAKETMDKGRFEMEFCGIFSSDSNGFFRRSLIESCTVKSPIVLPSGPVQFTAKIYGDQQLRYVYGVDPASESDNFCIYIVELWSDHVRCVYCWTINREKHHERFKKANVTDNNFYAYCARKIRDLMKVFPCEHIALDSQGGGIQIMEALHDFDKLEHGELPLYPLLQDNPLLWENSKNWGYDDDAGLHIIEMVSMSNNNYVVEANHGLKKDLESKVLLFPHIDAISLSLAEIEDQKLDNLYDTLQNCILEIEESKEELSTIMHTTTLNGRDQWKTPEVLVAQNKRERMRKDRYSALLMANAAARRMLRPTAVRVGRPVGGFAVDYKNNDVQGKLYTGADWFCNGANKSLVNVNSINRTGSNVNR